LIVNYNIIDKKLMLKIMRILTILVPSTLGQIAVIESLSSNLKSCSLTIFLGRGSLMAY